MSVLVIEMSRKSLGGWRAKYSRGWQKDVSAQGDGEPHVLGTAVATFCQKMGQSGKRTPIRLIRIYPVEEQSFSLSLSMANSGCDMTEAELLVRHRCAGFKYRDLLSLQGA